MDEISVNTQTSRLPPAIADFGSDSFVVIWTDFSDTVINGQRFLATGVKSLDEFQVNTTTAGSHHLPTVTKFLGFPAGFVVAWIADNPPACDVLFQRFSDDGRKFGEVRANSTPVNPGHFPAIASLLDGSFVVCWTDALDFGGIHAKIFRSDGTVASGEIHVNASEGVHFAPIIARLDNGGFVIAWEGGESHGRTFLRFQKFDFDGSKAGPEIVPPRLSGFGGEKAVTFLHDDLQPDDQAGRFVIVHISNSGGREERLVVATPFDASGNMNGGFNVTHFEDRTIASMPAVAALEGGRFVVTWTEQFVPTVGDRTERNVKAKIMSATEGTLTGEVSVSTITDGNQFSPCVARIFGEPTALGAPRELIAFAWVDDSVSGSQSSLRAVKARCFTNELGPA